MGRQTADKPPANLAQETLRQWTPNSPTLFLLGVSLVVSYLAGRALAKRAVGRLPALLLVLVGGIIFLIGQAGSDIDHRFRLLALAGLSLQVTGAVSVFIRGERPLKVRSVDLWAPQK
jgi:hypothetical protein